LQGQALHSLPLNSGHTLTLLSLLDEKEEEDSLDEVEEELDEVEEELSDDDEEEDDSLDEDEDEELNELLTEELELELTLDDDDDREEEDDDSSQVKSVRFDMDSYIFPIGSLNGSFPPMNLGTQGITHSPISASMLLLFSPSCLSARDSGANPPFLEFR
jgi:hypothetical protein